jgi:hypothetical protein
MADQDMILVPVVYLRKYLRMSGSRQVRKLLVDHLAKKEEVAKVKKKRVKSTKKS